MKNPIRSAIDILSTPDVATAQARAEKARQAVAEAQAALDKAVAERAAADAAADAQRQQSAEAGVLVAERAFDRASRTFTAAQSKLEDARRVADDEAKAAGVVKLKAAGERYVAAAKRADAAIASLADAVGVMDECDQVFAELLKQGIASTNGAGMIGYAETRSRVERATIKAGIVAGYVPQDWPSLGERAAYAMQTLRGSNE